MQGQGCAVQDVHAGNVSGHQIDRVEQRFAFGLAHVDLRAGQRLVVPEHQLRTRAAQPKRQFEVDRLVIDRIGKPLLDRIDRELFAARNACEERRRA